MRVSNNTFLQEINTAIEEIDHGNWQGKEKSDIFSGKILNLFRENSIYYLYESQEHLSNKPFVSSVTNLIQAMERLNQTKKTSQAIEKISNILKSPSGIVPGSEDDLKRLPTSQKKIQSSILIFKTLKQKNIPNIPEMLAKWIEFYHIPLSELSLSNEELLELAPFLTYLCIDTKKFTDEEIQKIISKCSQLETLNLSSHSITRFPSSFPKSLKYLDCSMSNIEEITDLPEGLKEFFVISCEKLTFLPEKLPQSMEIFNCSGCIHVSELPILNEGLKKINFSTTQVKQLPIIPSTLTEINMRECQLCEELPDELPESLIKILADYSGITKLPLKFPPKLTLTISWCPSLKLPKDLASIPLPPGAKIIR